MDELERVRQLLLGYSARTGLAERQADIETALRLLERMLQENNGDIEALRLSNIALRYLGLKERALETTGILVGLAPDYWDNIHHGVNLFEQGRVAEARVYLLRGSQGATEADDEGALDYLSHFLGQ